MARTGFTSANYLKVSAAVVSAAPVTLAAWAKTATFSAKNVLLSITDSASATTNNYFQLSTLATGGNVSASAADTGSAAAATSAAPPTGAWFHAAAVFASSTDRRAFLNGANKGTNATAKTPSGMNTTSVGVAIQSVINSPWNGDLAEAAIWNIALSDSDVASLAAGVSPLLMHPEALVAYWPLIGQNSPENNIVSATSVMSITGSLSASAGPIIFRAG